MLFQVTYEGGERELLMAPSPESALGWAYFQKMNTGSGFKDVAELHQADDVPEGSTGRLRFTRRIYLRPAAKAG